MRSICLLLFMAINLQLSAQEVEKIKVPPGVVYKYCEPGLLERAKDMVIKGLSENPDYSLCNDFTIIGPVLWSRFGKNDELANIEGGKTVINVDGQQLSGKATQSFDDSKKVWDALRDELKGEKYLLRKAFPNELTYFWSIISFDIDEPLIVIETAEHSYILDFLAEPLKLFWLEEVPLNHSKQERNQAKVSDSKTISEEELEIVKDLGSDIGIWAPMIVWGSENNIVCRTFKENATETLTELGLSKYSELIECNHNIEYDEANKTIENIAAGLFEIYGSETGDYFRIMCYNIAAQFYITFGKDNADKTFFTASILLTFMEMENAVNAAERIGVSTSIISDGKNTSEYIKALLKSDTPLVTDVVFEKLFKWRNDALDAAKDIILR